MASADTKLLASISYLERKIAELKLQHGTDGKDGEDGRDGLDGKVGPAGKDGRDGKDGKDGKDGEDGEDGVSVVDADVDFDNHLRFTLSDGSIVDAGSINVEDAEIRAYVGGGSSGGGGNGGIKYTEVLTTTYTVDEADLIVGHNLYGVDSGGDSVVFLPVITDPTKVVVVSNEMSGTEFIVTTQSL